MVAILDYDMGNVMSIYNMLKKLDVEAKICNIPEDAMNADKIILPGVGTYDAGMENLEKYGFKEVINEHVNKKGKAILGICLGMQMLGRSSEEGKSNGLNLIPFDNVKFNFSKDERLKVPHMGWNKVKILKETELTYGIDTVQRFYFVHSYYALCDNIDNILFECDYGGPFAAAVFRDNVYGVQFHPEKSHKFGMNLLNNFARRC